MGEGRRTGAAHDVSQRQDSAAAGAGPQALAAQHARRPALDEKSADPSALAAPVAGPTTSKHAEPTGLAVDAPTPAVIPVGRRATGGETVDLPTALLPRHTAIIAEIGRASCRERVWI